MNPNAAVLLAFAALIGILIAGEDDDYADCLLDTPAKIMKSQGVKDAAKALVEAPK